MQHVSIILVCVDRVNCHGAQEAITQCERNGMEYIEFEHVNKTYNMGNTKVKAVDDVSFQVEKGDFCVVLGPSGAGKTSILNLLGGMDRVSSGTITVGGKVVTSLSGSQRTDYRRLDVGFVFQFYNLIPNLTALENVELAEQICPNALDPKAVLEQVGLQKRLHNFPAQLSGGEQQRVSIARALCKNPALLLCDEPTGALDSKTGIQVLSLLYDICHAHGTTVVLITHNETIARIASRVIRVKNGTIESVTVNDNPARMEDIAL